MLKTLARNTISILKYLYLVSDDEPVIECPDVIDEPREPYIDIPVYDSWDETFEGYPNDKSLPEDLRRLKYEILTYIDFVEIWKCGLVVYIESLLLRWHYKIVVGEMAQDISITVETPSIDFVREDMPSWWHGNTNICWDEEEY